MNQEIAQLVSDIKCEVSSKYSSLLNELQFGIKCNHKNYDFSLVKLELLFLENIHYFDIEDYSLILNRNYKNICKPIEFSNCNCCN